MGKFKRSRARLRAQKRMGRRKNVSGAAAAVAAPGPERKCFQRPNGFVVCERVPGGGWTEVSGMRFDTCEECKVATNTDKCYE